MITPEYIVRDMFSLLSGESRERNITCLKELYRSFSEAQFGRIRADRVAKEVKDTLFVLCKTDEDYRLLQQRAQGFLKQMLEKGYFDEPEYDNQEKYYSFTKEAYTIVETLLALEDEHESEYKSDLVQIRAILENTSAYESPYDGILLPMEKITKSLLSDLRKLRADLRKRTIRDSEESLTLEDRYERRSARHSKGGLFDKFQRLYHASRTGNISHYCVSKLSAIRDNEELMQKAVKTYAEYEKKSEEDADLEIRNLLNRLIRNYGEEGYDKLLRQISERLEDYYNVMQIRAQFMRQPGNTTVQEQLKCILRETKDYEDKYDRFEDLIRVYRVGLLDLFGSRVIERARGKICDSGMEDVSTEDAMEAIRRAEREQEEKRFENLNRKILALLGGKDFITHKDVRILTYKDAQLLANAIKYSQDDIRMYDMDVGDRMYQGECYEYPEFTLRKKG